MKDDIKNMGAMMFSVGAIVAAPSAIIGMICYFCGFEAAARYAWIIALVALATASFGKRTQKIWK